MRRLTEEEKAIVEANMGLVRIAINKTQNLRLHVDDRFQVGVLGLMNAVQNFNPEKNFQFPTYATKSIVRWMCDADKQSQCISTPWGVKALDSPRVVSLNERTMGGAFAVVDQDEEAEEPVSVTQCRRYAAWLLDQLPTPQLVAVQHRFWANMTMEQIGQTIGVEKSAISKRVRKALRKLAAIAQKHPPKSTIVELPSPSLHGTPRKAARRLKVKRKPPRTSNLSGNAPESIPGHPRGLKTNRAKFDSRKA